MGIADDQDFGAFNASEIGGDALLLHIKMGHEQGGILMGGGKCFEEFRNVVHAGGAGPEMLGVLSLGGRRAEHLIRVNEVIAVENAMGGGKKDRAHISYTIGNGGANRSQK